MAVRTVTVAIDSIAAGGDGVGRVDGLVVFVPRTAPGDVVTATVTSQKHFARGKLRAVVEPSPARVEPSCLHYTRDRCGGCQLQHLAYTAQIAAKRQIITDAMSRIGKREIVAPTVRKSPDTWRYRAKLTMAVRRTSGGWIAGLHAYDDPSRVFPVADCPITDSRVVAAWREVMAGARYFPALSEFRGSVRWTDDGPVFVLMGGTRWSDAQAFFESVTTLAAVVWEPEDRTRVVVGDRRSVTASGDATQGKKPMASFAQVNPSVALELHAHVEARVLAHHPIVVVDGYAGHGGLATRLSAEGIQVTAIELDPEGAAWCAERLSPPSRAIQGKVEDVLAGALPADVVAVNPPRAGLHERVPMLLEATPLSKAIVYTSCDPATLARDVRRLPSFNFAHHAESIVAFDMFPQTAHVETVCELLSEAA